EDGQAALGGDRHDLLDAVVVLDAGRHVERRRGDLGAQCLEHRVAAGHDLRLVGALLGLALARLGGATTVAAAAGAAATALLVEAVLRDLALARRVVGPVLRLGGGLLALEGLPALPAGSDLGALAGLAHGAGPRLV